MIVQDEFEWRLDNGHTVIVEAEGAYFEDGGVWPVKISIITPIGFETYEILKACMAECGRIEDHAKICLGERAREILNERTYA